MDTLNIYAIWMIVVFVIGYALITLENITKINKATIALMIAIICWILQYENDPSCILEKGYKCFSTYISAISQIVFFILGALTIVEIISNHQGFRVLSDYIQVNSKRKLLWVVGFIAFFLSSVLDNLTTTIVMVTLLQKIVREREDRLIIGSGVVIAANAGGAWTPIGDVTTTMLWIGGQITTVNVMKDLFIPSIICLVVSLFFLTFMLKGNFVKKEVEVKHSTPLENFVFFLGIGLLIFVPIFKYLTHLPPFMGMFFGLSVLWIITDWVHGEEKDRMHLKVPHALSKIDFPTTLFFLGILLAVSALENAQILEKLAEWLDHAVGNVPIIATLIGLVSAVVDNVPLVAGAMGMYTLTQYPQDSQFWQLIAYCAGTGGSILIVGSAAGVVFMGLEEVDFFWYLRRISFPALIGYLAGIGIYLLGSHLFA